MKPVVYPPKSQQLILILCLSLRSLYQALLMLSLSVDVSFVGAGLREHMDFHLKWTKIAASTFQSRKGG